MEGDGGSDGGSDGYLMYLTGLTTGGYWRLPRSTPESTLRCLISNFQKSSCIAQAPALSVPLTPLGIDNICSISFFIKSSCSLHLFLWAIALCGMYESSFFFDNTIYYVSVMNLVFEVSHTLIVRRPTSELQLRSQYEYHLCHGKPWY